MPKLVRWKDNTEHVFSDMISTILSKNGLKVLGNHYYNISVMKHYENTQMCKYLSHNIEFNSFSISYQKSGITEVNGEESLVECKLIVYAVDNDSLYYVGESLGFQPVLRLLLDYTKQKEIEQDNYQISSDMLMWIVSKAYSNENKIYIEPFSELTLKKIVELKGKTDDEVNQIEAKGETVLKLLSTLSFILESSVYKSADIQLTYGPYNNLIIRLFCTARVSFNTSRYSGEYEGMGEYECNDRLSILIYTELLPMLLKYYNQEVKNNAWTNDKKVDFLQKVAEDVKEKINQKINQITLNKE